MKYMKLGNKSDNFYTKEATRSVHLDIPCDLTIQINRVTYLLHKFPLLPKCGLLRRLCSDSEEKNGRIEMHDIPGGEEAFELCAKFCYGITIHLGPHNFNDTLYAAKFLEMTESVETGNLVLKLEAFFNSCIIQGWKESIVVLNNTVRFSDSSENLGIASRCTDAILNKIHTPPSQVSWSFTYSRSGYEGHHRSVPVPQDWWTEDVSDLNIDLFQNLINFIAMARKLHVALIGEALHVFATRWLPDSSIQRHKLEASSDQGAITNNNHRKILESIVSMIPDEEGATSVGFLFRLLKLANTLRVSPSARVRIVKKLGKRLNEAKVSTLIIFSSSSSSSSSSCVYDLDLVKEIVESFMSQLQSDFDPNQVMNVGKLVDSYLQVILRETNQLAISKVIGISKCLPEWSRPKHDELYRAVDIYLKKHPDMEKFEKKRLCSILDCRKLSSEVCLEAIRNESLPLRLIVQILFAEEQRRRSYCS